MGKKIGLLLLLILIILLACIGFASWRRPAKEAITRQAYGLHTVLNFKIRGITERDMDEALRLVAGLETQLDRVPSSPLGELNRLAGTDFYQLPHNVAGLLHRSLEHAKLSEGIFNPAMGRVITLWGIGTDNPYLPTGEEVAKALSTTNWKSVQQKGDSFFLPEQGTAIDLGAIAKGYVADQLTEFFKTKGATDGFIDLGGNIYVFGAKPDGTPWNVGIRSPEGDINDLMAVATLRGDWSIVTSGPYEQFFIKDGVRYHHIFDPATGYPSDSGLEAVTVIGKVSETCDMLSTALFVMGEEKGRAFLKNFPDVTALFVVNGKGHAVGALADEIHLAEGWQ